jgi:drug/metabolite transporter (DMT)-like permease
MPAERSLQSRAPTAVGLVAAFAAVYLIWGSTYLAIRFAIETMPPFLMAGMRHFVAGIILYTYARWRGAPRPNGPNWKSTAIIGILLLFGGNGGVVWAEQYVPSGVTALMVATVPLWMVLADWLRPRGTRPTAGVVLGVLVGFAGMVLLVRSGGDKADVTIRPLGAVVLTLACLWWSIGSVYSRHAPLPKSPLLTTAMEMLAGGAVLLIFGACAGEFGKLHLSQVSLKSAASLAYLTVFGSLIAFSAYVWLLQVSTPARVGTYAYVNPIVAVFLGWLLASEPLTARMLVAAAIIVMGVVIITTYRGRAVKSTPADESKELTVASELAEAEH